MATKANPAIITCAVTGAVHTPTMSPHLPITPSQIVDDAVAAAEAGASILHLHARDPENGKPTASAKMFDEFVPRIQQRCDAVINITTGGSTAMQLGERLEAPRALLPELCSLNMGSMNFVTAHLASRYKEWRYDWEKPYLEATKDVIFRNTFSDIETILTELGEGAGTRFEFECYDLGHLYTLAHFVDRGLARKPLFIQMIFGILGGVAAEPEHLVHMVKTAERLFGDDFQWSVLAAGRHQLNFCTIAASMGGHVRVGMEDSLYAGPGKLAESNAEQVAKIRNILETLGRPVASADEARSLLALRGAAPAAA